MSSFQPRSYKHSKEHTNQRICEIYHSLLRHRGKPAILLEKQNRETLSYFVKIELKPVNNSKNIRAFQRTYHPDGGIRGYVTHTLDPVKILIGEQQLIFFDDGI